MPYRVTESVVQSQRPALDAIVAAQGKPIALQSRDTARLAFKIREALHAARVLGVEPYASLSVRIHDHRLLGVLYVMPRIDESVQVIDIQSNSEYTDTAAVSAFDIVASASAHREYDTLLYPNATLADLDAVQRWCERNGRVAVVDESEDAPVLQLRKST